MRSPVLIISIVQKGWGQTALEASIKAGATGGTIFFGRGVGVHEKDTIFGIPIEPEKEILLTLAPAGESEGILDEIVRAAELNQPGRGLAFVVPVNKVVGVPHIEAEGLGEGTGEKQQ